MDYTLKLKRNDLTLKKSEGRPNWIVSGSVDGKRIRISTGTPDYESAKLVLATFRRDVAEVGSALISELCRDDEGLLHLQQVTNERPGVLEAIGRGDLQFTPALMMQAAHCEAIGVPSYLAALRGCAKQKQWRLIPSFSRYQVSRTGAVRRTKDKRPMKQQTNKHGYKTLNLVNDEGLRRSRGVHQLVCTAFHGLGPSSRSVVRHINGTKTDNRAENLYWGSQSANMRDKCAAGKQFLSQNQPHHKSKIG